MHDCVFPFFHFFFFFPLPPPYVSTNSMEYTASQRTLWPITPIPSPHLGRMYHVPCTNNATCRGQSRPANVTHSGNCIKSRPCSQRPGTEATSASLIISPPDHQSPVPPRFAPREAAKLGIQQISTQSQENHTATNEHLGTGLAVPSRDAFHPSPDTLVLTGREGASGDVDSGRKVDTENASLGQSARLASLPTVLPFRTLILTLHIVLTYPSRTTQCR